MVKEIIKIVAILGLTILGCFLYIRFTAVKLAYIDISKIYNEFKFTKELDFKLKATNQKRKELLDSVGLQLKMLETQINNGSKNEELIKRYEMKREEYLARQEQFSNDNAAQAQEYNEQILKQVNQYAEDFRKDKRVDIIFGANGNGVIMAGNETMDLTGEYLAYLNSKYKPAK